jgi:hypothetical protein
VLLHYNRASSTGQVRKPAHSPETPAIIVEFIR